jgi:hypothetical protein
MRLGAVVCSVVVVAFLAMPSASGGEASVYGGIGTWVDLFASTAWEHPETVVASLRRDGVQTLYLETSNYSQPEAIVDPAAVGRFVDAAHAAGIQVVAWYLPAFASPVRDLSRALAAIRFRSPSAERFDSFALDIEASVVRSVAVRNARLLSLLAAIRRAAPAGYPIGAIIPSPVGMRRHPHYWPGFPYRELARTVDAFLPMAYFTHYTDTRAGVYAYTRGVIHAIRARTADPQIPIHVIGGIADHVDGAGLAGFRQAVAECGVAGVSLYAYLETSAKEWSLLRQLPLAGAASSSRC